MIYFFSGSAPLPLPFETNIQPNTTHSKPTDNNGRKRTTTDGKPIGFIAFPIKDAPFPAGDGPSPDADGAATVGNAPPPTDSES
ncbi:hypothetical protein [Parapedobacter sp. 2B3]|uniref:hypothetical protein n=1 Tax=Parapedobacter sp. 2B3 TaxID=3342381 RepID=UPI0035B68E67